MKRRYSKSRYSHKTSLFFKKLKNSLSRLYKFHSKLIYMISGFIILLVILLFFLNKTFLAPIHTISTVLFSKETISAYEDPYIMKDIKNNLIGNNFFMVKFFDIKKINDELKTKYKIIQNISIEKAGDNKVLVNIEFYKPNIVFYDGLRVFGTYNEQFFDLYTGSSLLSGLILINLPNDITNIKDLNGFYYKISEEKLVMQISEMLKFFGQQYIKDILYIPGGSKTIFTLSDGKKVYFNNDKNIGDQLNKYFIFINNFKELDKITEIDLGSNDNIIIKGIEIKEKNINIKNNNTIQEEGMMED